MRPRAPLANRDLIMQVRVLAKSVEPHLQLTCSCKGTAISPVPASERSKPFSEKGVMAALPEDERAALEEFRRDHELAGHTLKVELVLMGV